MKKRVLMLSVLLPILVVFSASSLSAQRRHGLVDVTQSERHGFWLQAGVAAGSENVDYSNEPGGYGKENVQPALWFGLGGTVNPHLRLGGEVNAWIWDHTSRVTGYHLTDYLVGGLLTGQFYPS